MAAGDHLRVTRGEATDHAIDVGDRTVIRWRDGAGVERVERAHFAPGDATVEVVVHRERIYKPALVVARAFSRFAESAYRGMFASAEQFAVWCKSAQLPAVTAAEAPAPARAVRQVAKGTKATARKAGPRLAPKAAAPAARRTAKPAAKAKAVAKKASAKPKAKAVRKTRPAARKVAHAVPKKKVARKARRR